MEPIRGIITKSVIYRDNDKLLNLFSPEKGMLFAAAYGARGIKNELTSSTQLFVHGEYMVTFKNGKAVINSGYADEAFIPICRNYKRFTVGCCILQAINLTMQEYQRNEDVFNLLHYCLSFLAYSEQDSKDLLTGFFLKLMQYTGFAPAITNCAHCGEDLRNEKGSMFSNRLGGAICPCCSAGVEREWVSALTLEAARRILLLHPRDIIKITLPERIRDETYELILKYVEHTLERKLLKIAT